MKLMIRDLVILICLCLVLVFLWFRNGLIFAGGEEGIPFYDLDKTTQLVSYIWQGVAAGFSNQLLLSRMPYFIFLKFFFTNGVPGFLVQALHFFIIMVFGSISLYLLLYETVVRELKTKNSLFKLVPLIGAVFYLLNPFSMTQIWGRGLYIQFFPFALFPFFLLMFILGIRSRNFIYAFLGLAASIFFAGAYGNPSYILSQWILIGLYLAYYIFSHRSRKKIVFSLLYFSYMLAGWIAVQMWWIYPLIKGSSSQFSAALNNWRENIGTLNGVSRDYQLTSLLRLIHDGYFYRDEKYGSSYASLIFTLISFFIPFFAYFSYSIFKKLKVFIFFGVLLFFSLFICLGSNLPTGPLFVLIFKTFPIFQSFRNPFEKFGVVLTMAYAPFFALGIIEFASRIGLLMKRSYMSFVFLFIILFLVWGVFLWPVWTGQFAGGFKLSPWVKVPDYYKSLDDWLSQQKDDGRIIHFPMSPGDGVRYSGWGYPYQGTEPGEYIFHRSSIGKINQSFKPYYSILLQRFGKFSPNAYGPDPDFTNSEFRSKDLYEELANLNVRYIVLHRDIDPVLGEIGEPAPVAEYLKDQKNIKKVNSFGKLDVFQADIPENIALIYSPEIKLNYSKINPTLYLVTVSNAKALFSLYFLEGFDPNWEAYINNIKVENHERVFSYANAWKISQSGDFTVVLKYKLQDYVNDGLKLTAIALVVSGLAGLVSLWKIKRV